MRIKIKSLKCIQRELPSTFPTPALYFLYHTLDELKIITGKWHTVVSTVNSRKPRTTTPAILYNICFPDRNIEEYPFLAPDWFIEKIEED